MPEQTYPISCQSCGKQLYGLVTYCPYCAVKCAVAPTAEAVEESTTSNEVNEVTAATPDPEKFSKQLLHPKDETVTEDPSAPPQKVAPEAKPEEQKQEPVEEKKDEPVPVSKTGGPDVTPLPPGKLKWIAVAVVLFVGVGVYLFFHKKGVALQEPSGSQQSSIPASPSQGKKESARIIAQDALRQGTNLSLTISKIPKLEKVLQAAKKLGEISPRYQEEITSAERTLHAARTERDKSLMAYDGKIVELSRYTTDQMSYAMGVVQNGDLTPREKIVAELLAKEISSIRGGTADPKKLLSDFTRRFGDYVD